jgi:DNA-directed RNA polymerase subunit M/transcription elongation factor TFIIS
MIGIDCPWCGDEMELEDVMTQAALRCDTCATEIELADPEPARHVIATAA